LALDKNPPKENDNEYPIVVEEDVEDIDDDFIECDEINLLGITP